jgi:AcrR family transcriptional regulator
MSRVAAAKRDEYAETRREQILTAALRAFSEGGFAETTMDQVAAQAGVAKGSLYLYFPSKDALLEDLIQRYTLLPELPELIESLDSYPPALGIPMLVGELWKRLRERKELARVQVREIQSHPARGRLYIEQVVMRASRTVAGYLEKWIKRGEIKPMNAMVAAQSMFGMLWYFLLTQDLMGGREVFPLADQEIVTVIAQIFLGGTAKRKARSRTRK